jgi:hypothetical protein
VGEGDVIGVLPGVGDLEVGLRGNAD